MKKVTAFVSSARKKNTFKAVTAFLANLQARGDIETEIVVLNDYKLGFCKGCMLCFDKGEEFCPLKDDRDVLFEKMMASDGVVLATPNYTFGMSGAMKAFLDRFGFVCHRPRFFGKTFTSIVTQGFGQGNEIVKNLAFVGAVLGFNTVKGVCLTGLNPYTETQQEKTDRALAELSQRFYARLTGPAYPEPSYIMMMGFRMSRNAVRGLADPEKMDYRFYTERGWLEAEYFYPTRLGWLKRTAGNLFDRMSPVIQKMFA